MSHELQVLLAGITVLGSILGSTALMLIKFGSVSQQLTTVQTQLEEQNTQNLDEHKLLFQGQRECNRERGELKTQLLGNTEQLQRTQDQLTATQERVAQLVRSGG